MDTKNVTQLKAIVPLQLKRQLFALLQLRGMTFLEWLRAQMEASIVDMGGSLSQNDDEELLYPLDKERVAAARRRKSGVGKRDS